MSLARIALVVGYLSALCQSSVSAVCSTDFEGQSDYPYKYFPFYTLYDTVRGNISTAYKPTDCSAKSIVMFLRHGSRHPGASSVEDYQALVDLTTRVNSTGNAELCSKDLEKIKKWKNWHQPNLDMDLAVTGFEEMEGIAQFAQFAQFAHVFPDLFSEETSYRFISSEYARNVQSAAAFKDAIPAAVETPTEINNLLTRFYIYCEKYFDEVYTNTTLSDDLVEFKEGPYIAIADEISQRLGIPRSEMSDDLVNIIKEKGCAFEEWTTGNDSAWCLAFTKSNLQASEYAGDIDDYWRRSFGHEINYKQSCVTKQFMLSSLKNATESTASSSVFLFSHYPGVMSLITGMKVIEDEGPLLSQDYPEKIDRTFRGSVYAPGAGNLALVLYDCDGVMKIQVFLNEKLVGMPLNNPQDGGLWNLEDALQYFGYYDPEECLFDQMCANSPVTDSPGKMTTSSSRSISLSIWCFVGLSAYGVMSSLNF